MPGKPAPYPLPGYGAGAFLPGHKPRGSSVLVTAKHPELSVGLGPGRHRLAVAAVPSLPEPPLSRCQPAAQGLGLPERSFKRALVAHLGSSLDALRFVRVRRALGLLVRANPLLVAEVWDLLLRGELRAALDRQRVGLEGVAVLPDSLAEVLDVEHVAGLRTLVLDQPPQHRVVERQPHPLPVVRLEHEYSGLAVQGGPHHLVYKGAEQLVALLFRHPVGRLRAGPRLGAQAFSQVVLTHRWFLRSQSRKHPRSNLDREPSRRTPEKGWG